MASRFWTADSLKLFVETIHYYFQLEKLESHTRTRTSAHRMTFVNSFVKSDCAQEEMQSVNHYSRALYESAKEMKRKATSVRKLMEVNLHLYCFETCEEVGQLPCRNSTTLDILPQVS